MPFIIFFLSITLLLNTILQQIYFKSIPPFSLSDNILLILCQETFYFKSYCFLFYVYSSFYFENSKYLFFRPLP